MSTHDNGFGRGGRASEFESDFAVGTQDGQSWGASTANTQKGEVAPMAQGGGRPGQPNVGQRSIFGNGGPSFTQMPTYTPVTRGNEQQPASPQPSYAPQPQQPSYAPQPQQPARQPQAPADHSFQQPQPQHYGGNQSYQPQGYNPAPSAPQTPSFSDRDLPDLSNSDSAFPDSIFGDFKAASFDTDFSDQGGVDPNYYGEGDASFPETGYEDQSYSSGTDAHYDMGPSAQPQPPMQQPQSYYPQSYQQAAPQQHGGGYGQVPPADPGRQLQAYDNQYDQPPQVALGGAQVPMSHQDYGDADRVDADFMDETQMLPPPGARSKLAATLKGRSAFMVGSALLGAIALGGALAFAYKQSGGGIGSGDAPMITADSTPVKEAPDEPGGKEFPHKNKLIYDRLTNGDTPESERIVPRQEDVAVPAMPPAAATAGLPAPVATTDLANAATTQSVDGAVDEEGGPRKVKTMVVRPDGSVEAPAIADAANAAADAAQTAAAAATQAAGQAPNMMPVPIPDGPVPMAAPAAPAAAPQQVAAADPAPAPAASQYVVQVGAHKSQTDALAVYADLQQKNPKLLGNYPPLVQKASVGGGTMYRLRVGPIASKSEAYKLCGDLKAQGTDCFVAVQ